MGCTGFHAYVCLYLPVPCLCVWMHFYGMVGMRVWHGGLCSHAPELALTCVTPLRGYLTPSHQDEYRTSVRCAKCKQPVTAVSAREKLCTSEQCKHLVFNRLGPTADHVSPPPTPACVTSRGRCTCGMAGVCVCLPARQAQDAPFFYPPPLTHTHTRIPQPTHGARVRKLGKHPPHGGEGGGGECDAHMQHTHHTDTPHRHAHTDTHTHAHAQLACLRACVLCAAGRPCLVSGVALARDQNAALNLEAVWRKWITKHKRPKYLARPSRGTAEEATEDDVEHEEDPDEDEVEGEGPGEDGTGADGMDLGHDDDEEEEPEEEDEECSGGDAGHGGGAGTKKRGRKGGECPSTGPCPRAAARTHTWAR